MKLWLIVPVKPFAEGKSRLAAVLSWQQRQALNQQLFHNLLKQAQRSQCFTGVIVVGRDPAILTGVTWDKLWFEQESQTSLTSVLHDALNSALEQGRQRAVAMGAEAILILPADLPLITTADIAALTQLGQYEPRMVIAPSQDGGTSALLLHPPQLIPFAFGGQSCTRHCALAHQNQVPYHLYRSDTLAKDVDWPQDLQHIR